MSKVVSKTLAAIAAVGVAFTLPAAAQHLNRGEAIVYKDPGFRGPALVISGAEPNLAEIRFNDTISSIQVHGTWEICVDPNFRGKCTIINGSEDRLSYIRMNDNITSLRPVSGRYDRRYRDRDRGRDYGRSDRHHRDRDGYRGRGDAITLFKHPGFRGSAFGDSGAVTDLKRLGFNDTASSIYVRFGSWLVCEDPHYRGRCVVVDRPVASLSEIGLNDRITSIRPYDGRYDRRRRY